MRATMLRIIALLEVAGGFYGVTSMGRHLLSMRTGGNMIGILIALALYTWVLLSGWLLLEGRASGVRCSRWSQLLQLPVLATPVLSYSLHCAAGINVLLDIGHWPPELLLATHIGSEHLHLTSAAVSHTQIGVNLLALASWLVLAWR